MTEETLKHPDCFLVREDSIRRLPRLVFAASEACRRKKESMAALPKALGAQCTVCGFVLSGEELLALAEISSANKESAMLQRLRHGRCARESCKATHYRLQFYDTPEISWSALLAESRPGRTFKAATRAGDATGTRPAGHLAEGPENQRGRGRLSSGMDVVAVAHRRENPDSSRA